MKQTDTQKAATLARRAAHFAALEALHNNDRDKTPTGRIRAQQPKPSGRSLWLRLRRIETRAHRAATAQCNGEAYQGEPFRVDHMPDGRDSEGDEMTPYEAFLAEVRADVARVLGGLPAGFSINQDPRGYALKIRTPRSDPKRQDVTECPGLCTDWGGLRTPCCNNRMNPEPTLCIFRRWRSGQKSVIAIFPYEVHDPRGIYCESYEHTGQHGGADPTGVIRRTRPASLDEPDVAALRRELEGEPFRYKLEVRQKAPSDAYQTRRAKLSKQYGTQ